MSAASQRPGPRPLFGGGALLGLIGGAGLLLFLLLPYARGRLDKAQSSAPSSLSLNYMELSLLSHPQDSELRRTLVKKQIESGQLAKARETLKPLLAETATPDLDAHRTLLALDRAAWAAVPTADAEKRAQAMGAVLEDLRVIATLPQTPEQRAELAKLYLELEQPTLAAELLDKLAREAAPATQAQIGAADAAWLAAGSPRNAAELQAFYAAQGGDQGLVHARLAIARAQGVGDSALMVAMIERMRALYPKDLGLLELATEIAEGSSVARAYDLAGELVRAAPSEPKYHRLVARLGEATGHQLRALDEYVWLVRHGGTAADRERAIALAKSNWDLPLLRELLGKTPKTQPAKPTKRPHSMTPTKRAGHYCQAGKRRAPRPAAVSGSAKLRLLREELALDEALGDHRTVLKKLTRALEGELGGVPELWQRKLDLESALGLREAALSTAQAMLARFGKTKQASERVASLQLAQGDTRAALATLLAAELPAADQDDAWLMRLAALAFEAGDIGVERSAYEKLTQLPGAAQWQYQRLWELAPDRQKALQVALTAFDRFESESMFYAALSIHSADHNEAEQVALLERGERYPGISARADYWQTRISLQQQRTARALDAKDYPRAKRELGQAAALMERAGRHASLSAEVRAQLLGAQRAQTLALGLGADDRALIAEAYATEAPRLSARERVYILQKLGRNEEALLLARQTLSQAGLPERDRSVLELDALALSAGREQYVRVSGEALQMDGLATWGSVASVRYTGKAAGLHAELGLTQLQPRSSATPVLSQDVRELNASLQGRMSRMTLELGVRARDEGNLRPFGMLGVHLGGDRDAGSFVRLHVNGNATDTARQRAWATRDALELQTALPLGAGFYVSARGLAEAYYTRLERQYLGAGLSLDAGVGVNVPLSAALGAAGFRLTGRAAPRFAKEPSPTAAVPTLSGPWLPGSSEWAGVGASLGRGKLDAPPLLGRAFCYVLDGAAGWLWPQQGVGFSAQAGLGFSVFGADLLTLAARGGNVVGSTVWSANLGYGVSLDR